MKLFQLSAYSQWKPDVFNTEAGAVELSVMATRKERGHNILVTEKIGRVEAILRLEDKKLRVARIREVMIRRKVINRRYSNLSDKN